MKKNFTLPRPAKGQSLVELAVSLVILLFLLSGIVEFGIIFFQFVQLRDAAQEGALYGSINPPPKPSDANYATAVSAIENRALSSSSSPIDLLNDPAVDVIVEVPDGKYCEGGSLRVTVKYPHKVFMPFMSQFIGPSIPLNAEVTDTILTPATCPP